MNPLPDARVRRPFDGRLTLISDCRVRFTLNWNNSATSRLIGWNLHAPLHLNALFTAKPVAWQGLLLLRASLECPEPAFNRRHSNADGDFKFPACHPWLPASLGSEENRWPRRTVSPIVRDLGQTPRAASLNTCAGANGTYSGRRRDTSFPVL